MLRQDVCKIYTIDAQFSIVRWKLRRKVCLNLTLPAGATACWRGSRVRDGIALVKKSHKNFCFGTDSVWLGSAELAITEVFSSSTLINSLLRGICKKPRCYLSYHISYKTFLPIWSHIKISSYQIGLQQAQGELAFLFSFNERPASPLFRAAPFQEKVVHPGRGGRAPNPRTQEGGERPLSLIECFNCKWDRT